MKPKAAGNLAQIWFYVPLPGHCRTWIKIRQKISASPLIRNCSPTGGSDSVCFLKLISCLKNEAVLWCKGLLCIKCESVDVSTLPDLKRLSAEHQKALFTCSNHLPRIFRFSVSRCFKEREKERKKSSPDLCSKITNNFNFALRKKKKISEFCENNGLKFLLQQKWEEESNA